MKNKKILHESPLLREKYYEYTCESGLKVYVFPKKMTSTYALFATKYGSVDNCFRLEGDDEFTEVPQGIAHFLEHKMFTAPDGSDAFDRFALYGADANAYTSYDKTVYLFSCSENFERCFDELIEFVTHPYFTDETVKKEQGIIAQEIRMTDDLPSLRSYYGMLRGLYSVHHIRNNICGTEESISRITPELLYRCNEVFYSASNMAIVVCGDVDPDQIYERVSANIGEGFGVCKAIERLRPTEPREICSRRVQCKMQVAKPIFSIGIKDVNIPAEPAARARRDAIMSMINDLLFSQTGELYNGLYDQGLISPDMSSSYTISESFAFHSVSGESYEPDVVFERVREYVERVRRDGVAREDFERCRKVFYSSFVREFDSTDDIANNLIAFVFDGIEMFDYADIIASLTYDEVMEALRSDMTDDLFCLSVVYPFDK